MPYPSKRIQHCQINVNTPSVDHMNDILINEANKDEIESMDQYSFKTRNESYIPDEPCNSILRKEIEF